MAHGLMKSRLLIVENKRQLFIGAKDKNLSCFAIDKGKTKVVFADIIMLGSVF